MNGMIFIKGTPQTDTKISAITIIHIFKYDWYNNELVVGQYVFYNEDTASVTLHCVAAPPPMFKYSAGPIRWMYNIYDHGYYTNSDKDFLPLSTDDEGVLTDTRLMRETDITEEDGWFGQNEFDEVHDNNWRMNNGKNMKIGDGTIGVYYPHACSHLRSGLILFAVLVPIDFLE